jgi:hypothetical protein
MPCEALAKQGDADAGMKKLEAEETSPFFAFCLRTEILTL